MRVWILHIKTTAKPSQRQANIRYPRSHVQGFGDIAVLRLAPSVRFRRDVKRMQKRGKDMNKLKTLVDLLVAEQPLPASYKVSPTGYRLDRSGSRSKFSVASSLVVLKGHVARRRILLLILSSVKKPTASGGGSCCNDFQQLDDSNIQPPVFP